MSTASFNPTSTSGIGFKLEHYIQVAYLSSLILGIPVPFSDTLEVNELLFQAKHLADTDDLIVHLSNGAKKFKHYLQSKKGFEINKNKTFDQVIDSAYKDFKQTTFNRKDDKFIIFTDTLAKTDADDGIPMLEWARFSKNAVDFLKKLGLNKSKQNKYNYFKNSLELAAGNKLSNDEIWKFLKCFYVKSYDYLSSISKDRDVLIWFLQPHLAKGVTADQALLKLLEYVEICNQNGASLTIANVTDDIKQLFSADESNRIGQELKELFKKSKSLIDAIENSIDSHHIPRDDYFIRIDEAIHQYKLVVLTGDGGVGKSSVVKDYIETVFSGAQGFISFKGDILDKSSLAQSLSEIGVHSDMETLIGQWQHLPNLIIYIDSFEKLYESDHPEGFMELLKKIQGRPNITILATCRSYAFETLRKKFRINVSDIVNIPVSPLSDADLDRFAVTYPQISGLLKNAKLRKILSLPYFLGQAIPLAAAISDSENICEADFKNAIWEQAIEKIGFGQLGHSQMRGTVFSKIILKRAREKQAFTACEQADLPIAEELVADGLLLKHSSLYQYAPKHDVLEDLVVTRHLDELFAAKTNAASFMESIDANPVVRRGIRIWVQQLILKSKEESKVFLTEALQLYKGDNSLMDEFLIGILGADKCYELLLINESLILADNLKLYNKLFQLAKLAYVLPYEGENAKRSLKSIGPAWNSLVKFLDRNYDAHKDEFDTLLIDLYKHWMLQFEVEDELPDEATLIAAKCVAILNAYKSEAVIHNMKDVLEIFFWVAPAALTDATAFIQEVRDITVSKKNDTRYPIRFIRELNKMLLIDTYRCEKLYCYFPDEIIEIAKAEWYSAKEPSIYSSSYRESSFGLVSHPYEYFSASVYQTPFRYLFKYHFDTALKFLIELTNRSMSFYVRSDYANDLEELMITLIDGSVSKQIGNYTLFSAYRGDSNVPYLIQSALMALEANMLERAAAGDELAAIFKHVMLESKSVLITGVLVSIATAYPFAVGDEIDALFKLRILFAWDLTRYTSDFSVTYHTSTIGNDLYYTNERHLSNQLAHRRRHLEMLVTTRQLYFPKQINEIIDAHVQHLDPDDKLWKLALLRMDIRNTTPELLEDEQKIAFIPKPLPEDIQTMIDENQENQNHDANAISIHLYANRLLRDELEHEPTITEWREYHQKLLTINFDKVILLSRPDVELAISGINFFSDQLSPDERKYCVDKIMLLFDEIVENTKLLKQSLDPRENNALVHILPKLFAPEFEGIVDNDRVKEIIQDILIFGYGDLLTQLIFGIKAWGWTYEYQFADACFKLLLKKAYYTGLDNLVHQFYQKSEAERTTIAGQIKAEVSALTAVTIELFDISTGDRLKIVEAIKIIPYNLLANEFYPFLEALLKQLHDFPNLEDYNEHHFVSSLENILANFILFEFNKNTSATVYRVLMLFDKHHEFVLKLFESITAIGHDRGYPDVFWKQLQLVLNYFIQVSPKLAFLKIMFLYSLRRPDTARKLDPKGENRFLHETLTTDKGIADQNITTDLFTLLSGIGSVYQPDSLKWLMQSFPTQETYYTALNFKAISALERYAIQLFDNHLGYLKSNKEALDYFILILNVLITYGSREAFRMRDIIV